MGTSLSNSPEHSEAWPKFNIVSVRDVAAFLGRLVRPGIKETALHRPDHYDISERGAEHTLATLQDADLSGFGYQDGEG